MTELDLVMVAAAQRKATAAQREELAQALADEDGRRDPDGVTVAWAELVLALVREDTPYQLAVSAEQMRACVAVAVARRRGRVTSADLARIFGTHQETARLTLQGLTAAGLLAPAGGRTRGRYYTAA